MWASLATRGIVNVHRHSVSSLVRGLRRCRRQDLDPGLNAREVLGVPTIRYAAEAVRRRLPNQPVVLVAMCARERDECSVDVFNLGHGPRLNAAV